MSSAFTNAIARGFRSLFAPRITTRQSFTVREITPGERKAFDAAFAAMDTAFTQMGKAFDAINQRKSGE